MSLTSSLFSGISGLSTLGNSMQIIGDNIANVNTVGFKGSSYVFQDLLSQATATQSGTSQIGRGTALGDIYSSFEQGSFESTGNTTDLGIGGDGFFILRESSSQRQFYTRAGNFRFDQDGLLVNPEGYVVQGWTLDSNGDDVGSLGDIRLSSFTSPPDESDHISIISNLDSSADIISNTDWMANSWNGINSPPIASNNYEYQTTVKVYDSLGSSHDVTVYYDRISGADWEYIVTCNPNEDQRTFLAANDASAGLLARGTINFSNSAGTVLPNGLTMETMTGTGGYTQELSNYAYAGAAEFNATNTTPTVNNHNILNVSQAGVVASFDPAAVAPVPQWTMNALAGYPAAVITGDATQATIDLDNDGNTDITLAFTTALSGAGTVGFDITGSTNWTAETPNTNGYYEFNPDFIGGAAGATILDIEFDLGSQWDGTAWENDSLTTTQFARASTTSFQSANGYGAGDFQGVDVDVDGIITGIYSNGELIPLNRVGLAKFLNVRELHKEGGNLYRETRDSGDAITGQPGTNGLGDISPNSLEQSNVDIANEFVKMITSQRGFQANSKIITTVDSMLGEVIAMKR